jgi:transcriptional regulator with XRE-family HTH domain
MEAVIEDDDVKQNVAENIRRLLLDRGWSQSELSRRTGEPVMTISAICNAKHVPGVGIVARIAEAFDVSVDRLVGTPPEPPSAPARRSA